MIWDIILVLTLVFYTVSNLAVANKMSVKQMRSELIEGQCTIGMVCANIFYSPAWFLKVLKAVVVLTIK